MPIRRIEFGEWLPDLGEFNNQGLYKVKGAVRSGGRWHPNPIITGDEITGNAAATYDFDEVGGFHVHTVNTGTGIGFRVYAGVTNDILRGTANDVLTTQRATAAGLANTFNRTSGWQFTSFGDEIYAAMFNDSTGNGHFVRAVTPSSNFATFLATTTPTTYNPLPRYVSYIKNHLLIGYVEMQGTLGEFTAGTVYPNLVMWSATDGVNDGPTRWGDELTVNYPETVGSSYQFLNDGYGPITGLCGGGDHAYIFKSRAVYRMDGPEWTFHPVVTGAGTRYPNSITRFYNDVYFWGPCGPARLRSGSSEIENLGFGKVRKAITEFQNYDFFDYVFEVDSYLDYPILLLGGGTGGIDISAAPDYRAGLVSFFCADFLRDSSGANPFPRSTGCLVYDVATGDFSFFSVPGRFGFAKSVPRYGRNPATNGAAVDFLQHSVLDGIFGVGVDRTYDSNANSHVMQTVGDADTTHAITISGAGDYLYDWFPKFTTAFNPLLVDDANGPITTSVKRVRIPFTIKRFDETVVTGYTSSDYAWTVKVNVTVRSKNRYSGETEQVTGSWTSSDSYQPADGWIDLSSGKGSTEAEYHQFEIEIVTLDETGVEVNGIIVHLRDLTYFEVEYEVGNPTGSTYLA